VSYIEGQAIEREARHAGPQRSQIDNTRHLDEESNTLARRGFAERSDRHNHQYVDADAEPSRSAEADRFINENIRTESADDEEAHNINEDEDVLETNAAQILSMIYDDDYESKEVLFTNIFFL
jgi:hypothetical protein